MSCCGRNKFRRVVQPARKEPRPATASPERVEARKAVSGLCARVEAEGTSLEVSYLRGALVVIMDGVKFELFSALRSQGCNDYEWVPELSNAWNRLSVTKKEQVIQKLEGDHFPVSAVLGAL